MKKITIALMLPLLSVAAALPPDPNLAARQRAALEKVGRTLVPMRDYGTLGIEDCSHLLDDCYGLVARLEFNRRGLPGDVTPAEAAPWAAHLALNMAPLIGTNGVKGPGQFSTSGKPSVQLALAPLAYALHRYGAAWPAEVKKVIRVAAEDGSWPVPAYIHNADVGVFAGQLLAAEALGDSAFWDRAMARFEKVVDGTMRRGGIELNAPLYTGHHFPGLVFMQALKHPRAAALARTLLEYELLFQAHLYLPGGGLGAPQMRDYSGGGADGGDRALLPALWLLIGDPALTIDLGRAYSCMLAHAATDYVVPEVIRSIFLDKGDGYTGWAWMNAVQGKQRSPHAVYNLGVDGAQMVPMQAVMLPGGNALLGAAYGATLQPLFVSSGVYVRRPSGGFAILYQYQPKVIGDTEDTGSPAGGSGLNTNPDDFTSELYDHERMVFGRTAISLWDPTMTGKRAVVVRTHQDTRVHLPNYDRLGGETTRAGEWRVGRLGETYVAYAPLGHLVAEGLRDQGQWTYLRLDGRSGGIVELATTAEFKTLAEYAAELKSRHLRFTPDPLAAEVDARDPVSGHRVRIRLEFRPERRVVDGVEQSTAQALDHGLIESPWVSWDKNAKTLRVAREGYRSIAYDWLKATVEEARK